MRGKREGAAVAGDRRHRAQRGQSLVEVGVSSIVLLLLITGLIDLSRAFYFDIGMHGAAYAGARHAAWFDFGKRQNIYLSDAEIVNSVNQTLSGSGLTAVNGGACPTGQGNSQNNPPYDPSLYPSGYNTVRVYLCYTKPGSAPVASIGNAPAPFDYSWRGADVNVILLMNYGLVTGFLQSALNAGGGVHLAANTHFTVQGGY